MLARSKEPGRIVTFYSYKGGTGRSMLLANVAWVLASAGKHVLTVDWDLEAPGLHRYFHPFLPDKDLSNSEGLIDFVFDFAQEAITPPISTSPENQTSNEAPLKPIDSPGSKILRYACSLDYKFQSGGSIDFIPAGRQGPLYGTRVGTFNWHNFYERLGGGAALEAARDRMKQEYDYILIDSRTGVSDTSGICTVQMPDDVVVCFTLNNQSVEGASAVAASIRAQRLKLEEPSDKDGGSKRQPRPKLRMLAVPTRIDLGETEKLYRARLYARDKFARCLSVPEIAGSQSYWKRAEVQYYTYYAYEEVLATFGDEPDDPKSMLASVERITNFLTAGEVSHYRAIPEEERLATLARFTRPKMASTANNATGTAESESIQERLLTGFGKAIRSDAARWAAAAVVIIGLIVAFAVSKTRQSYGEDEWKKREDTFISTTKDLEQKLKTAQEQAQKEGRSRELAAIASTVLPDDPQLAALLAIEAGNASETPQARRVLNQFLQQPAPKVVMSPDGVRPAHTNAINLIAFSRDGSLAVTASDDGLARVWDTNNGTPKSDPLRHEGPVVDASFDDQGEAVLTASYRTFSLWPLRGGKPFTMMADKPLSRAIFSADGGHIITVSTDSIKAWDRKTWHVASDVSSPESKLAISDNGKVAATWDQRGFELWDVETGKSKHKVELPNIKTIKLSSSGTLLAIDRVPLAAVAVWSLTSKDPPSNVTGLYPTFMAFSRDEKRLLIITTRPDVEVYTLERHESVVMGSEDEQLPIGRAIFSIDGSLLATYPGKTPAPSFATGTQIWFSATGKAKTQPLHHAQPVTAAAFSPNGKYLATGTARGNVQIWPVDQIESTSDNLPFAEMIKTATQRLNGKTLTDAQRQKYLGDFTISGGATSKF